MSHPALARRRPLAAVPRDLAPRQRDDPHISALSAE
jgi:hypothetical protein